jgi:hypothetical protein
MIEEQKLTNLNLSMEKGASWRGGFGNEIVAKIEDKLVGKIHIEVTRKKATRVMDKDIDLKHVEEVPICKLPQEIRDELLTVWRKIEKLL